MKFLIASVDDLSRGRFETFLTSKLQSLSEHIEKEAQRDKFKKDFKEKGWNYAFKFLIEDVIYREVFPLGVHTLFKSFFYVLEKTESIINAEDTTDYSMPF